MAEVASAYVSLIPSARGFGSKLNGEIGGDIDSAGKTMGSRFGNLFKVGAMAVLGAGVLAGKFLSSALDEAREAQVVTARTENVIKKMGNAAGISAKQVADLAGQISAKTGIDDEAIQSGQNLLLTFGNIRDEAGKGNDIFSQTTQLMVDMSAAMGTEAKGAAIQLGKALNDPVKGVTALTRAGVSFSEEQKKTIETMVATGDTMGAQKVILAEVEKQFGGAAEAMATPADKARVAWDNFKEQIGTAIMPALDRLLTFFTSSFIPGVSRLWDNLAPAREVVEKVATRVGEIIGLLRDQKWGEAWQAFKDASKDAFDAIVDAAGRFITDRLIPKIVDGLAKLKTKWSKWWGDFWEPPDKAYAQTEQRTELWHVRMGVTASETGASVIGNLMVGLSKLPDLARRVFASTTAGMVQGLSNAPMKAASIGVSIVGNLIRAFDAAPAKARAAAVAIASAVIGGLRTAGVGATKIGVYIIQGLISGIRSMASQAAQAAVDVVMGAVSKARSALGINSPSRVFAEMGMWSMAGFAKGIEDNAPKVLEKLKTLRDGIKSQIDEIKSDMASLSTSVASAFTGNLFEATDTQGFMANLMDTKGQLKELKSAFKKLVQWGLSPQFLSQLFSSGNGGLILDLAASGNRGWAMEAAQTFGQVQSLSNQLGGQVAQNQYGDELRKQTDRLERVEAAVKRVGEDVAKALNNTAANAARSA